MPKAMYKTKGVSPAMISNVQHLYQQVPVADQAWDLTLPKVSGNRGDCHSSIASHLGNLGGGLSGPSNIQPSLNITGVQTRVFSKELNQGTSGGVLHPQMPLRSYIKVI